MSPRASDPNVPYAQRLAAIRAEISNVIGAPYRFGHNGPHRRQRDEEILRAFAADNFARMIEAEA